MCLVHTHLCPQPHSAVSVLCPGGTNGTAVEKEGSWMSRRENQAVEEAPTLLSPTSSSALSVLLGWLGYLYPAGSNLSSSSEGTASQGEPVLPPSSIFSNRTASNSSTKLFWSLCFAPTRAAPAKGTEYLYIMAQKKSFKVDLFRSLNVQRFIFKISVIEVMNSFLYVTLFKVRVSSGYRLEAYLN